MTNYFYFTWATRWPNKFWSLIGEIEIFVKLFVKMKRDPHWTHSRISRLLSFLWFLETFWLSKTCWITLYIVFQTFLKIEKIGLGSGSKPHCFIFNCTYFLFRHGSLCATHPKKVIFLMLVFVAVSCLGLLNFQTEANAIKLWIPAGSDFARDYDYLWSRYPPNFRMHSVIFTSDQKNDPNILQPKYIQQVYQAYKNLTSMQLADNKTWWDFCLKVPIVKVDLAKIILGNRKKREENDFFSQFEDGFIEENDFREIDPSVEYYPSPYCSLIEGNFLRFFLWIFPVFPVFVITKTFVLL